MKNTKQPFSEILRKTADKNSQKLMAKARMANRLAKVLKGENRRRAYSIKSRTLCGLICNLPNTVNISRDFRLKDFVVVELKTQHSGLHLPVDELKALKPRKSGFYSLFYHHRR